MTIDETIRVNTVLKGAPVLKDDPTVIEALNLNIEALKAIQRLHRDGHISKLWQLPGETEPEPQPTRNEVTRYMNERKGGNHATN